MIGDGFPARPGTYVLLLQLAEDITFRVGALGSVRLPAGHYGYVGSALGPGGLRARVGRHLRRGGRHRWHVDYLLEVARVVDVLWLEGSGRIECLWLRRLLNLPGSTAPVTGFGSSDCRAGCPAHLVRLPAGWHARQLAEELSHE